MHKVIKMLLALMVVQAGLIAVTWSTGTVLNTQDQGDALLSFNEGDIDSLLLQEGDKTLMLEKKSGQWQTPDAFPANQAKVNNLLDKLHGLKHGLPIATSSQALQRFKVANDAFERHIRLQSHGKNIAELYVGKGAGARRSHVRNGQQKAVYTAMIGSYDLPVAVTDWQDKNILQIEQGSVTAIGLEGMSLRLVEDSSTDESNKKHWQLDPVLNNKQLDSQAVDTALQTLHSIRFKKVLGKEKKKEYGLDKPVFSMTLTTDKGKKDYQLSQLQGSEDYVLKVSDRDEYFQLSHAIGQSLINGFSSNTLLSNKNKESESKVE